MKEYDHLKLKILDGTFKYVLLENKSQLAECTEKSGDGPLALFLSPDEVSAIVPSHVEVTSKKTEDDWSCMRIIGEMPFGTVQGLIATVSGAMKKKGLGLCVISTFETDWFFVKSKNLDSVKNCLSSEDWEFV